MNLHPLFVHFPIALLSLYALIECASYIFFRRNEKLVLIKGVLVILGAITALPTILFGMYAESMLGSEEIIHEVTETHEAFAIITFLIFALLATAYALRLSHGTAFKLFVISKWLLFKKIYDIKYALALHMTDGWFAPVVAAIGLISLVITGALGAAITRGPEADAIVSFVYHFLF